MDKRNVISVFMLFVLSFGISNVQSNSMGSTRIVGGAAILIKDAPYQASLRVSGSHFCGATIISSFYVLTTAECIYSSPVYRLSLRVGSTYYTSGGSIVYVRNKIIHENFVYSTLDYDFGLLELEEPLIFNENILPIRLPEQDEVIPDGSYFRVTGWGDTKNPSELKDHLRITIVPTVNQLACQSLYGVVGIITDRMICAGYMDGGRDACNGDSGGALARNGTAYGIVSWGSGCALPNYPGVYSRIPPVVNWIRARTGIKGTDYLIFYLKLLNLHFSFTFFVLLFIGSTDVLSNSIDYTRIVGGFAILIKDAPYQAALRVYETFICGASIISTEFALTSADCIEIYKPNMLNLRVGSTYYESGGSVVYVRNKIIHEKYNYSTHDYDFGLLELEKPLTFNVNISAIRLPEQDEVIPDGIFFRVTGWGETRNPSELRNHLRVVYVPTVNQSVCQNLYSDYGKITEHMVCAGFMNGERDACFRDTGGALARNGTAYGIVSWANGCARPSYPGVYSRIPSVVNWIRARTGL